ncbi:putative heavy metal-associated domain, HMA, heavy metal-associated domain superfamily [Helianthus anomalus]
MQVQTCMLKVMNLHCEGCKIKVRRALNKVEGVIKVAIDAEQDKVTVLCRNVDPADLINKLAKDTTKTAEIWGGSTGNPQTSIQPVSSGRGGGETSKTNGKKVEFSIDKNEPEIQTESESE